MRVIEDKFYITFLDTRKVTKEYALAKELLKLCFVPLRQNNSLEDSLKQILSFNTPLLTIFSRNSFDERGQSANHLMSLKQVFLMS